MSKLNACAHCGCSLAGDCVTYQIRTHEPERAHETFALRTSLVGYFCCWECVSLYACKRNAMEKTVSEELPKGGTE